MRSKMVPSLVQTGCSNGWSDRAQKLYGSRLNAPGTLPLVTPEPALAEKAVSDAHSLWVICVATD